jgi:uncharacterized DUF497 family protein
MTRRITGKSGSSPFSWLDALLYTLIFRDEDAPDTIRAISLRKSTEQERNQYAQN